MAVLEPAQCPGCQKARRSISASIRLQPVSVYKLSINSTLNFVCHTIHRSVTEFKSLPDSSTTQATNQTMQSATSAKGRTQASTNSTDYNRNARSRIQKFKVGKLSSHDKLRLEALWPTLKARPSRSTFGKFFMTRTNGITCLVASFSQQDKDMAFWSKTGKPPPKLSSFPMASP